MEFDKETFGQNVKYYRKLQGLSQEQLAELCNVSQVHLSLIERGIRLPSIMLLCDLSHVLQVSLDDLMFGKPFFFCVKENNASSEENKALLRKIESLVNQVIESM